MAEQAWTRAFEIGDERVRTLASVGLGELLETRGDYEAAIEALERADAGNQWLTASVRASVAYNLGLLYDRCKDVERARSLYQRAIDANQRQASPPAAHNLGLLLTELGDVEGAEAAFAHAIEAKIYPDRAKSAYALAIRLQELGKLDRAQVYYERAIIIGEHDFDDDVASKAARDPGLLHEGQGAIDLALAAYTKAMHGFNTEIAAEAIWHYARLSTRGQDADLSLVYHRLLAQLDGYKAPRAACQLGLWLIRRGERDIAETLFEHAMTSEQRDIAAEAAFWRGWLAHRRDDVMAQAAYQQAIDFYNPEYSAKAATNLGVWFVEQGRQAEALAAFESVRRYPTCTATTKAAFNAGLLLEHMGETDKARTAFERAIDLDYPEPLPQAVARLARLLRLDDEDAAEALLEHWRDVDGGHFACDLADEIEELEADDPLPYELLFLTEPC
jgi:tetratricopeptide (TPR) repeat protein